jgi:hypothetical protein
MCYAEYNLQFDIGCYIAENDESNKWIDKKHSSASNRAISLEDEIAMLRSKMEHIFSQEKSFTSDNVIEISSLLDLKINEFMKKRKNK